MNTVTISAVIPIAVDQGNFHVKVYGPGKTTEPFPTGLSHHKNVPPPLTGNSLCLNGQYYSINNNRLQTRRDKTVDEDYYILTLAAIAKELKTKYPDAEGYDVKIALALGLPVEHLTLRAADGQLLRDRYRSFFSNDNKPIEFEFEKIPYRIKIVDVGVYAQTISGALSDTAIWDKITKSPRAYIVDIGGGTTNIINVINAVPQNPGVTIENRGVLELFKMAHRTVFEETGLYLDNFTLEMIMRGRQTCDANIRGAIERAKDDFAKALILDFTSRGMDLYMGLICFLGGGSVLLYDNIERQLRETKNKQIFLISDVNANAKGYYAQELVRLQANKKK